MSDKPLLDWQIRAIELRFDQEQSWKDTFEILNLEFAGNRLSFSKVRAFLRRHPRYKKPYDAEELGFKECFSIDGDTYKSEKLLDLNEEQKKDINYMLNAHGFNPKEYKLIKVQNKKWNVYSKLHGVQQLYSSSIVVEPLIVKFDVKWVKYLLKEVDYSKVKVVKSKEQQGDKMGIFEFPDAHMDKFMTALIAGGNSDINIAKDRYINCIEKAIQSVIHIKFDVIKYIIGQDFMNVDNLVGATTRLTPQDTNMFYEESYKIGFDTIFLSSEMIRKAFPNARLELIYIRGNHDVITTFTYAEAIKHIYEATGANVEVDTAMLVKRKYRTYGDSLTGFGHGETERKRIFDCMQVEAKDLWHKSHKYFFLSHYHSERTTEKAGVIYRWLGSTSVSCLWSYSGGWIGSEKKGHVLVFDKSDGLITENYIKI